MLGTGPHEVGIARHAQRRAVILGFPADSSAVESYYIWCDELPTELIIGVDGDVPQYAISFTAESIRESGRKRCSSRAKELDQGP